MRARCTVRAAIPRNSWPGSIAHTHCSLRACAEPGNATDLGSAHNRLDGTTDRGRNPSTIAGVSDAIFRASSISAIDSEWVDTQVADVLTTMFAVPWQRVPLVYLASPITTMSVNVGGLVDERLTLRANEGDCAALAGRLGLGADVTAGELLAELANTLVGHLKVGLADGLTTGIPERGTYREQTHGYHAVFSMDGLLLEVVTHA